MLPVFAWCHLFQIPLASAVVVIVHIVVDFLPELFEGDKAIEMEFVLHVSEERLHRSVVPAVAFPGHGLGNSFLRQMLLILDACVLASLVIVDREAFRKILDRFEFSEHIHDKRHVYPVRYTVCHYLIRGGILHGRKIGPAVGAIEQIGDIGQKVLVWTWRTSC